jgi:hypothetical protein
MRLHGVGRQGIEPEPRIKRLSRPSSVTCSFAKKPDPTRAFTKHQFSLLTIISRPLAGFLWVFIESMRANPTEMSRGSW